MKTPLFAVLGLSAMVLAGCQSTGAKPPLDTAKYDLENHSNFVLFDKGAQRSVTVSGIQERKLPDGRLEVAANVRNRENRRIQVQINCVFKDAQGFEVDASPFKTLILDENAQETVSYASMNNKAEKYTFRVRQAR